jgi:hypothetical protein
MVPARYCNDCSTASSSEPRKRQGVDCRIGALLCLLAVVVQVSLTSMHAWHSVAEDPVIAPKRVRWLRPLQGKSTPGTVFAALDIRPQAPSAALPCPLCWVLSQSRSVVVTQSHIAPLMPTATARGTVTVHRLAQPYRLPLSPRAPPSPVVYMSGEIPSGFLV